MNSQSRVRKKVIVYAIIGIGIVMFLLFSIQLSMLSRFKNHIMDKTKPNLRTPKEPSTRKMDYSLTYAVATDLSQLEVLNYAVVAWMSEISVAVSIFPNELEQAENIIQQLYYPSRVSIHQVLVKGYLFPINELRNTAILHTTSTHFFISDADIVPSLNLRESFLSLSSSYLSDIQHAFIVPLIETPFYSLPCKHWYDCIPSTREYVDLTKQHVKWCLLFGGCKNLGSKGYNKYMDSSWDSLPLSNISTPLQCWDNIYQQPFLIVAKSNHLPQFDTNFVDFGYNRIEWVSHLRYANYSFSVLSQTWAFHLRHDKSLYAAQSEVKSSDMKNGYTMDKVYERVMKKWSNDYTNDGRIPMCSALESIIINNGNNGMVTTGKKRIVRRKHDS